MELNGETFLTDDDSAFVSIVTNNLVKGAAAMRGLSEHAYIQLARQKWSQCSTDCVYSIKLLVDTLVEPQLADSAIVTDVLFCILIARIDSDGELMDAPPGYQQPSIPGVLLRHVVAGSPPGARTNEPEDPEPYVYLLAYLDVLGFEALLNRIGLERLNEKYALLLQTAVTSNSGCHGWSRNTSIVEGHLVPALMWLPIETTYFSDSLLLWAPYHPSYVEEFLRRCARVFCEALKIGLPIRGAVSCGKAVLHSKTRVFLGNPLIEAARLEASLNWIGIALGTTFKSETLNIPIPPHMVHFYEPPMKAGKRALYSDLVLDWPRVWRETYTDSPIAYLRSMCSPDLAKRLRQRYESAIQFYEYSKTNENWIFDPVPKGPAMIGLHGLFKQAGSLVSGISTATLNFRRKR